MVYTRDTVWKGFPYASWEKVLAKGHQRAEEIAAAIERETRTGIEGRRALDFGCGVGRIAIPLAERCEHVYGIDIATSMREQMSANAAHEGVSNIEALPPEALPSLAGRYDLLVSLHVLQHIRMREGEQLLRDLLRGLAPGGVGYVNLVLRPAHPLLSVMRWIWLSPRAWRPKRRLHPLNPVKWLRVLDTSYVYMMRRSYSLNRLGRVLAEEGIGEWHVHYNRGETGRAYDAAALIFQKP